MKWNKDTVAAITRSEELLRIEPDVVSDEFDQVLQVFHGEMDVEPDQVDGLGMTTNTLIFAALNRPPEILSFNDPNSFREWGYQVVSLKSPDGGFGGYGLLVLEKGLFVLDGEEMVSYHDIEH